MARGGRPANIKIDGAKLDAAIRASEGDKFNQGKISRIIMGRDKSYYRIAIKENSINSEVLDKVCEYYELNRDDYLAPTPSATPVNLEFVATSTSAPVGLDSDKLIELLTSIDKSLQEIAASERATQFVLSEIQNSLLKSNSNEKTIIDKLDARYNKPKRTYTSYTPHKDKIDV